MDPEVLITASLFVVSRLALMHSECPRFKSRFIAPETVFSGIGTLPTAGRGKTTVIYARFASLFIVPDVAQGQILHISKIDAWRVRFPLFVGPQYQSVSRRPHPPFCTAAWNVLSELARTAWEFRRYEPIKVQRNVSPHR
jgi:hypothetical protein